jgi:hypothetical protein
MINREGNYDDGLVRQCTCCKMMFVKTSKTVTICKECNSNRVKLQPLEVKMWRRAKNRAAEKGLEFDIEVSDIIIPDICPILGIPIKENKGKSGAYPDSPSLDKIDPTKGYIKGNVQVVSQMANMMKYNATQDQLRAFANYILKTYPA